MTISQKHGATSTCVLVDAMSRRKERCQQKECLEFGQGVVGEFGYVLLTCDFSRRRDYTSLVTALAKRDAKNVNAWIEKIYLTPTCIGVIRENAT